jgi:DNA polymerase-3 subunit alpha
MKDLQDIGLTKFDFLGLKTLTVIQNSLLFIEEGRSVRLNMEDLPLDDPKTYELLGRGDTDGVFQLESSGMKDLLVNLRPDCIEDIIALIALYRPGPMSQIPDFIARKQGRTKITYEVPQLKDVLQETYGVIVYQEQVMQIAGSIGGYSMADADNLRRLMSKKKPEEMEKEKPKFLEGAKRNAIPQQKAQKIWDRWRLCRVRLNKSHSALCGITTDGILNAIIRQEFWCHVTSEKRHGQDHPISMAAAPLGYSSAPGTSTRRSRIQCLEDGNIRFGLAAVKNVGVGAVEAFSTPGVTRESSCLSKIFAVAPIFGKSTGSRESLVKCGAFDSFFRISPADRNFEHDLVWQAGIPHRAAARPVVRTLEENTCEI